MKGKQLRKAVLLGMAMSMAVWTTGMAETPVGPITESYNENNEAAPGNVTVENGTESASIQIGHENTQDVIVNIKTETNGVEPGDILLWGYSAGVPTHSAIYVGNGQMIHATNPRQGVIASDVAAWTRGSGTSVIAVRRI